MTWRIAFTLTWVLVLTLVWCGRASATTMVAVGPVVMRLHSRPYAETCVASQYNYGPRTANGERFSAGAMAAAHRWLPFGTRVRVTDQRGRSVVVRINDRGPYVRGRCIDLTAGAARALGFRGLARVRLEIAD